MPGEVSQRSARGITLGAVVVVTIVIITLQGSELHGSDYHSAPGFPPVEIAVSVKKLASLEESSEPEVADKLPIWKGKPLRGSKWYVDGYMGYLASPPPPCPPPDPDAEPAMPVPVGSFRDVAAAVREILRDPDDFERGLAMAALTDVERDCTERPPSVTRARSGRLLPEKKLKVMRCGKLIPQVIADLRKQVVKPGGEKLLGRLPGLPALMPKDYWIKRARRGEAAEEECVDSDLPEGEVCPPPTPSEDEDDEEEPSAYPGEGNAFGSDSLASPAKGGNVGLSRARSSGKEPVVGDGGSSRGDRTGAGIGRGGGTRGAAFAHRTSDPSHVRPSAQGVRSGSRSKEAARTPSELGGERLAHPEPAVPTARGGKPEVVRSKSLARPKIVSASPQVDQKVNVASLQRQHDRLVHMLHDAEKI